MYDFIISISKKKIVFNFVPNKKQIKHFSKTQVVLTRAKLLTIVVGNPFTLADDQYWSETLVWNVEILCKE